MTRKYPDVLGLKRTIYGTAALVVLLVLVLLILSLA